MKNLLIVLFVLILVGAGGYFGWRYYQSQANVSPNLNKKTNSFVWGVTARPHAINKYNVKDWTKLVGYANDLGVNYVRLGWDTDNHDPVAFNKAVIDEVLKQGMSPMLGFESKTDIFASDDPYTDGYDAAFRIATLNKDKVKYYQILNEVSSVVLRGGEFPGDKEDQYDASKYAKMRDYLKGAIAGIKKADPAAQTILTGQWTQYAFFDMLARDKVDYDIIGWDWYSGMGMIYDNKTADGSNVLDHLKKLNKPIFLTEVGQESNNADGTSSMDEDKQADYFQKMAEWAYNSGVIKGFIAFQLTDIITTTDKNSKTDRIDRSGLVQADKNSKGKVVLIKRKAFGVLQSIIAKYSK